MQTPRTDPTLTLEQRQAIDRKEYESNRIERAQAERVQQALSLVNAKPVVLIGIAIPFWRLVWWIVGLTAGVNMVNAAFEWAAQIMLALLDR